MESQHKDLPSHHKDLTRRLKDLTSQHTVFYKKKKCLPSFEHRNVKWHLRCEIITIIHDVTSEIE